MVGCASNKAIDSIVARLFHGEEHLESYGAKKDFPLGGKRVIGTPAHYAYLKIAEGCNNRCHYCAIPGIRGPLRSREMADCVAEARWLAGEGVKELIIVAQDPTAYGEDWGKPGSICELLDKLNKIPGLEWIRIMYAYPERITDDFIAAMKRNEKVVPYLDLPIQHCNDTILKNMNRRSTRAELLEVIGKLRREIPGITLRTTLIAGFPGETEEQFEDLCNFVKEVQFDRLGCFAYSAEENTVAAKMDGQIDQETKDRRAELVMQIRPASWPRNRPRRWARPSVCSVTASTRRAACTSAAPPAMPPRWTAMSAFPAKSRSTPASSMMCWWRTVTFTICTERLQNNKLEESI